MMMTETCQIWGTFLKTISLLGLGLGNDISNQTRDLLQCDNCTKCEKEYSTTRREQICNYTCKMDVGNETKDNGQTCMPTERCGMECGRDRCKKQKCGDQVDECKMYLGCSRGDFKQTCNANTKCNMTCSGDGCKEQKCEDQVGECAMHCIASSCKQECNASTCLMTRAWPICSDDRLICSGNGICCGSLMPPYDSWTSKNSITSTECGGESHSSCLCTKYIGNYCTISDLYSSNAVTSITATTTHVFATQISTVQGTEHSQTYTLLQSLSQLPLSLISPSPSPLPSSSSSSAGVSPAVASASLSAPSSSSPSSSSASLSSAEALASSLFAPSSLTVSLTPAETSVSSSEPSPLSSSLSLSLSSSSRAVLLSSSPSPSSSLSSSWPSPTETSRLSTTEALKKVANDSVAKLTGIEIRRNTSLKEAVRMFEDFTDQYLNITKSLKGKIGIMEDKIKRKSIFAVASAFENFVLKYGKYYLDGTNPSTNITSENMVLVIQKGYRESCSDLFFNEEEWQASINISSANFAQNGSVIAVCVYKGLHELLLRNKSIGDEKHYSRYLNSRIMSVALDPKLEKLQQDVILKFRNLKDVDEKERCMFWSGLNKSPDGFSGDGCRVVQTESNSEETVCSCNHLTHFAVLVDFSSGTELSTKDITILEIITYVGLSLSILGMLLTIALYFSLTDIRKPLSQIRISLALALGTGQIIFLAGIKASEIMALCTTMAVLIQYFMMAAFCWMLVEGIYLYLLVVKVYNIRDKMHMYHVISWGLPLVVVAISLSIAAWKDGIESYTSDEYCWMSSSNGLIWMFVTFVGTIAVSNILILTRVIREVTSMQSTGDKQSRKIRVF